MLRIAGTIDRIEAIAIGPAIRELARLHRVYGPGRWRKMKGEASVELPNGTIRRAEIHWYEAHGIGRKELKIKRFVN